MIDIIEFDPEVEKIEDHMINFFSKLPMFSVIDNYFVKIFGYFLSRRCLTQEHLRHLTGFSAGKISQEINKFLDMKLIQKERIPKSRKRIYTTDSAGSMFFKYIKNIIEHILRWEDELTEMKSNIKQNRKKLENLNGFKNIYHTIDFLIIYMEKYRELLKNVETAIKSFK